MCVNHQTNREPGLLNQGNGRMPKLLIFRSILLIVLLSGVAETWAQTNTSPTQTVCPGIEPYLVIPDNVNNVFLWTIAPGVSGTDWTIIPGTDGYHISVNWANPSVTATYTLSLTETTPGPNSCSTTQSVVVTVNILPTVTAASNSPVCTGTPLNATGGPAGMAIYAWTGRDGFTSNAQNPTVSATATAAMAGIYTLTVTDGSGCTSAPATTTVVVNTAPIATAASNSPLVTGTPLTLTGGPAAMTSYSWTGPDGFTSNVQSPTVSATATIAMAGIYTLTVTDGSGCTSAPATTTVVVSTAPLATAASNSPVCTGMPLILTGGPAGMNSYSWTGPNGFTSTTQSPTVSATATAAMAGVYTLTVTDGSGYTSAPATDDVTINASPVPGITGSNPVCESVNGNTEIYSTANVSGNTYNWTVAGGIFTGQGTNQIVVTWTTPGPGSVSVVETGINGCSATNSIAITVQAGPSTSNIHHN